jgi:hypothetical protein
MEEAPLVPPTGSPLLVGVTTPHTATLELVPSSLDSTPPGAVSMAPHRVPVVPSGFLSRVAPVTPATQRAAPTTPAALHAVPTSPTTPCVALAPPASHGPPPRVWPTSLIAYVCHRRRPTALAAPALPMLTPRPVTVVPVTPPVNLHRMVTCTKAGFRMPREPLVLTTMITTAPPSSIPTSVHVALANPNWRAAMEEEYGGF